MWALNGDPMSKSGLPISEPGLEPAEGRCPIPVLTRWVRFSWVSSPLPLLLKIFLKNPFSYPLSSVLLLELSWVWPSINLLVTLGPRNKLLSH